MSADFDKLTKSLVSPADWAVVVGAAVAGFIFDGAYDLIALPFFSPQNCAVAAGGVALAVKRGVEVAVGYRARRAAGASDRFDAEERASRAYDYHAFLTGEAEQRAKALDTLGLTSAAAELRFESELASLSENHPPLEAAIRAARAKL